MKINLWHVLLIYYCITWKNTNDTIARRYYDPSGYGSIEEVTKDTHENTAVSNIGFEQVSKDNQVKR